MAVVPIIIIPVPVAVAMTTMPMAAVAMTTTMTAAVTTTASVTADKRHNTGSGVADKGTRWRSRPQTWPVPVAPQIRSTIRVPSYWRGTSTWRRCASREGPAPSADVVLGTFYVFRDGQLR
jgi:hypothetical protein